MNQGDTIRSMDNLQLAMLFAAIIHERDQILLEKLAAQGVNAALIEFPDGSVASHLEWLNSEL